MRTRLCDLVGIEAPIVLAPMGGAVTPTLAAAVSDAGALGMLPLSWTSPDEIATVVEETRRLTERPFGVNLGLAWDQRERLESALTAGVRVVSFFWGDASDLIQGARDAGAIVLVTVGTAEEGRAAAAAGADVVVAQGWEAGGHVWGSVSTLALVPRVVDEVGPGAGLGTPLGARPRSPRRRRSGAGAGRGRRWSRRRPRSGRGARARRRGRVGGYALPPRVGGGDPPGLPAPHLRRRGGRHLLRHPLRPRLGRRTAPHAPQFDGRGVG